MHDSRRRWRSEVLKTKNAEVLLDALLRHPAGLTQQALHVETDLAEGTVSNLVTELRGAEVILADKEIGGGRNRAPQRWSVRGEAAFALGVSIGLKRVAVVMLDAHGNRVNAAAESETIIDTLKDRQQTIDVAVGLLKGVVGTRERCRRVAALTMSLPGPIVEGALELPGAPSWSGENVRADLKKRWKDARLPLPEVIRIERDANAAAWAEIALAPGRRTARQNLLYLHWSASISAGLVLNGEVWHGATRRAGELGHVKVLVEQAQQKALRLPPRRWSECQRCGQVDCADVRANTDALAQAAGARSGADLLGSAFNASAPGHDAAREVLKAGGLLVGRALGPMLTMLDVDRIVVGGAVGRRAFDVVRPCLQTGIKEAAHLQVADPTPVEQTQTGPEAAAYGGAMWARDTAGLMFLSRKLRSRSMLSLGS